MAKIIPSFCRSESPGEKVLFERFSSPKILPEATILHSLNIAKHLRNAEGEADFVVLLPGRGILVLEVKHHSKVQFTQGQWILGADKPTLRGPLEQAREAMYAIREYLVDKVPETANVPIYYAAWFTNTTFDPPESIEWEAWQFLGKQHLTEVDKWVSDVMNAAVNHLLAATRTSFVKPETLNQELIEKISVNLRPSFETFLTEKENRKIRKSELKYFIEEQFQCLDLLEENHRTLTTGPAGTGKTLLSLEKYRRMNAANLRAAFICFNRNLANELASQNPDLRIFTMSSLIASAISRFDSNFVNSGIPTHEVDGPERFGIEPIYDLFVIDEAQDVFTSRFLPWLNALLVGGMEKGSWHAFGDFASQRLYQIEDNFELISQYSSNFAKAALGTNCRNLEVIGKLTYGIVPQAPKWKNFMRIENPADPELSYLPANSSIIDAIDAAIEYFRSQSFSYDDIVFLSPSPIQNPDQLFQSSKYADKFQVYGSGGVGKVRFSTIHSFKGLESSCVGILELYELRNMPDKVSLLYVALTRATDRLYLVLDPDSRQVLEGVGNERI